MAAVPLLALLLAACGSGPAPSTRVAWIGSAFVSEGDIADWQAIQACYGPEALNTRRAAFLRMLEAAVLEEALKSEVGGVAEKALAAEADRIDAETKAPEKLACIKGKLGGSGERYLRVFVRPVLLGRQLAAAAAEAGLEEGRYLSGIPKISCVVADAELRALAAGLRGNPLLAPAVFQEK